MSYGPQLPSSMTKPKNEKEDDESNVFGPVIPKNLRNNEEDEDKTVNDEEKEDGGNSYGPSIPKNSYGPQIPGVTIKNDDKDDEEEEDEDYEANSYGPSIPSNFKAQVGPALPPLYDSDEDIGPMPVTKGNEEKEELHRLYRLAMQKEAEEEEKNSAPKREEWMTAVPKKMTNFGLGPRSFKTGTVSERDDSWEDAPGAKKKKGNDGKSAKSAGIAAADARQAAIVDQKVCGPSLLEIHQKDRQEKVASMGYSEGERRPFDREKDMEVRGLKPGASKAAVDSMKEFSSRFANSKEQRFL